MWERQPEAMRTALTALGMIIGVAAVIVMVAIGTGARTSIEQQIRSAGTNLISVNAGSGSAGPVRADRRPERGIGGDAVRLRHALADGRAAAAVAGARVHAPEARAAREAALPALRARDARARARDLPRAPPRAIIDVVDNVCRALCAPQQVGAASPGGGALGKGLAGSNPRLAQSGCFTVTDTSYLIDPRHLTLLPTAPVSSTRI